MNKGFFWAILWICCAAASMGQEPTKKVHILKEFSRNTLDPIDSGKEGRQKLNEHSFKHVAPTTTTISTAPMTIAKASTTKQPGTTSESDPSTVSLPISSISTAKSATTPTTSEEEGDSSSILIPIIVIVVVLLAIILAICIFWIRNRKTRDSEAMEKELEEGAKDTQTGGSKDAQAEPNQEEEKTAEEIKEDND